MIVCLLLILIIGCENKKDVNVKVNNNFLGSNIIILDDTVTLKPFATTNKYANIVIKSGKHKLSINGGSEQEFVVGNKGGILNVERSQFVITEIKYSSQDSWSKMYVDADIPIVLDSLVIFGKALAKDQEGLVSLLKNSSSKDILSNNLLKFDRDQLFINKTWDYGINETPPQEISVKAQKDAKGVVRYKNKIFEAKSFLIFAKLSGNFNIQIIESEELIQLIKYFEE